MLNRNGGILNPAFDQLDECLRFFLMHGFDEFIFLFRFIGFVALFQELGQLFFVFLMLATRMVVGVVAAYLKEPVSVRIPVYRQVASAVSIRSPSPRDWIKWYTISQVELISGSE